MPELPEVEYAARCLRAWLGRRTITRATAKPTRLFRGTDPRRFARELSGRRLRSIDRRGKFLLLRFDEGAGLLSHLGMSGKWVRRGAGDDPPTHSRAQLLLSNGDVIHYRDMRLFGRLAVGRAETLEKDPSWLSLGPDPLVDGIDRSHLAAALARSARSIKVVLMDQAVLAGIGNIQATEALFVAKIHPARSAASLSRREVNALVRAIERTISRTLDHLMPDGRLPEARYVQEGGASPFAIYGRAGSACPRCRGLLEKLVLGGRTSAFCPSCQR